MLSLRRFFKLETYEKTYTFDGVNRYFWNNLRAERRN